MLFPYFTMIIAKGQESRVQHSRVNQTTQKGGLVQVTAA